MNVLFIYPEPDSSYPIQIGALSAFLKKHNHKTALLELVVDEELKRRHLDDVQEKVETFEPHLIGFSSYETSFEWIKGIADYVKSRYGIPVIVGGYYATLAPEEVIEHRSIDIVCRGEGEYPLLELVTNLEREQDINRIRNLWVKKDGRIHKNEIRPLIENLDGLPFHDREMMDYQRHLNLGRKDRNVKIIASRGCPFNCTYCSNHAFRQMYPTKNRYLRMRSVDHVLEEIEELAERYEFDSIGFHDDNLTLVKGWLEAFCEKYPQRFKFPFYCAARPETCTEKNLRMLKKAGCHLVLIGVEAGDENFRKNVLNRKMKNSDIMNAFRTAKKVGLQTWSFVMVGLPCETRLFLLKTIWLNLRIHPDFVMASVFYPFKGTYLGDLCYKNGWVNYERKKKVGTYARDTVLNHPSVTRTEIRIAKYLNALTAIGGSIFQKAALTRVRRKLQSVDLRTRLLL